MKRILQISLGVLLAILLLLAIILPRHGRIKHDIAWRTRNLQIWQEASNRFILSSDQSLDDLHEVYVFSYEWLKTKEFSPSMRSMMPENLKVKMNNDRDLFEEHLDYRLNLFSDQRWYIMEYSRHPKEERTILMIDQDGVVWKANREATVTPDRK